MHRLMRANWWKFLGIAILIYAVIAGVGLPLKPGVVSIAPFKVDSGSEVTFDVEGYNSHYTAEGTEAWLRLNVDKTLKAKRFVAVDDNHAKITFDFPNGGPSAEETNALTLIIHNAEDGPALLPNAVFLKSTVADESASSPWNLSGLTTLSDMPGIQFPYNPILKETIRNTYFHVPLWFSMFILLFISIIYSIKYLRTNDIRFDTISTGLVQVASLFGILGIITGSIWAKFAWGKFWTTDVKLNMSTVAMLIYMASLLLRMAVMDVDKRAKIFASYNIFAFVALIPLVIVIPRLTDSLHPGNGGNPAMGGEDMENTMRLVFYPAIIGFTLLGLWMSSVIIRYQSLKDRWLSR